MRLPSARQDGGSRSTIGATPELILKLMVEKRFPKIWIPTMDERDLRQLLIHRRHLVRMRVRIKNQLQHIALNQGLQKKKQAVDKEGMELPAESGTGALDAAAAGHSCWRCWKQWDAE